MPDSAPAPTPLRELTVRANAFTDEGPATGAISETFGRWTVGAAALGSRQLVPSAADPTDWTHPRIGWGIILPERDGLDPAALATADDAPEPIRDLVRQRAGKVLRYRPGTTLAQWVLRDYASEGDLFTAASPQGMGPKELPLYLLIAASPAEVPWQVQYALNPVRCVGRLDLDEEGLAHYVAALQSGWAGSTAQYAAPLVWSVDHGGGDITSLMREVIGATLATELAADADMPAARFIDGSVADASGAVLIAALAELRPLLVVTTSHGKTGPLNDPVVMLRDLGMLVDASQRVVDPAALTAGWQPDGAVWFAQACCSAGADQPSVYEGLFAAGGSVGRVLTEVARLGPRTAPTPRALLGAPKPLRAFIGQVEPTFNWTMEFPATRQDLTASLRRSVYEGICGGRPVGLAMDGYYAPIGSLLVNHGRQLQDFDSGASAALDLATYSKATAYDRASTVLLGDPTVAIPLPAAGLASPG
ncbi:hypothetical protein NF556_10625 [Ornithinimicrobium faecis]|uniref:CHAT domain-containing protein n=1 Tax=Ornithinimicrobium faecis TaxID=2934158 RepID=A0ABY4Z038_9MICO|nr:hypothetical protein [Ornithinimicrobium sp. HY1793]USQ82065.1 hypothetical protein NF556_10625 [Ornithinimicrobium sp. HY1793]